LKIQFPAWLFFIILSGILPSPAQTPAAPYYDSKLIRLSEILGSLHYLRNLCGDKGTQWRDRMSRMVDTEKPNAMRKTRFLAAFNNAYRAFSNRYYECTPAAIEAIRRYDQEGATLSQELIERYGN